MQIARETGSLTRQSHSRGLSSRRCKQIRVIGGETPQHRLPAEVLRYTRKGGELFAPRTSI